MPARRLLRMYSSSMSGRIWRITKCQGRSRSSTKCLAVARRKSRTASCRSAPVPRRWPLLRAAAELLNAANGVRPLGREGYITLPWFAFGWPTTEMSLLYLAGSVLDAMRRGLRDDFRGARGRIALILTAIAWLLLLVISRRNLASAPHFEEPLREALGEDYEQIAAQSQP